MADKSAKLLKSIKRYKQTGVADDTVRQALDVGYDFAEVVKGDGTWYTMPKAIVDDLDSAQKFFSSNESFNDLVEGFQRWQGMWKGGALFSVGPIIWTGLKMQVSICGAFQKNVCTIMSSSTKSLKADELSAP